MAAVWDPPLRPHENHAAAAVSALILRWGAEHVGIDLDREDLLRYQRHRRRLSRRKGEVGAVDEVGGGTVVGERGIVDLALRALELHQKARSVGAQHDSGNHAKHLLELYRAGFPDIGGIEE